MCVAPKKFAGAQWRNLAHETLSAEDSARWQNRPEHGGTYFRQGEFFPTMSAASPSPSRRDASCLTGWNRNGLVAQWNVAAWPSPDSEQSGPTVA
jgi:hypothetical protein